MSGVPYRFLKRTSVHRIGLERPLDFSETAETKFLGFPMQSWTPIRHLRAIGAWPDPTRLSHIANLGAGSTGCRHGRAAYSTSRDAHSPKSPKRIDYNADPNTRNRASYLPSPDDPTALPLPPFLRPDNHSNNVDALKLRHRDKSQTPHDIYVARNERTQAENLRYAPFSTAFALNPYAHALATPVREDRFSHARLPVSCLQDFHLVEKEAVAGGGSVDRETDVKKSPKGRKTKKNSCVDSGVELLPLSLAAELVPRKKNPKKLKDHEMIALEAWDAEITSWRPQGSASYILAKKAAVDHVSQDPDKRVKRSVVSRRVLLQTGSMALGWREDMGDYVLLSLRKVVSKKLGWLLKNKGAHPDKPGAVAAMPGLAGLERLDSMDDVMCVLRLKPKESVRPIRDADMHAATESGIFPHAPGTVDGRDLHHESANFDPAAARIATEHSITGQPGFAEEVTSLSWAPAGAVSEAAERHSNKASDDQLFQPVSPPTPNLHRQRPSPGDKEKPFLSRISSPPPVPLPSSTYYPTVPYRNRRVPGYNLPHLLGAKQLQKLVDQTAFKDCEYVAVAGGNATIGLQTWLLKLASYVHEGKSEEIMI